MEPQRALEVQARVPRIDGFMLDLIIDYVTCVIVPACFMYEFKVVPQNNFGIAVLCVMVFTSAIWFARKDMMTDDNWFLNRIRLGLFLCRRSSVAIYTALIMPALAGAVALGVEVTSWSGAQVDMQRAADASARAGSIYCYNYAVANSGSS